MTEEHQPFPFLPQVLSGDTADVYFLRGRTILRALDRNPRVGMEIFSNGGGVLCGTGQVVQLLRAVQFPGEVWSRPEGAEVAPGEPALQIYGRYDSFGIYETAIIGILASSTGWATAAREIVQAASPVPVISFGARHIHPNAAAFMDYAAVIAGCISCSTPLGAALAGVKPSGTMAHAFVLIMGDTVRAAEAFNAIMPPDVPRIVLVDTFQDEAVESVRVAEALGSALTGIRLDTPGERGGVTPALVKEVRARLDLAGFRQVRILVSGGFNVQRIRTFQEAGAPVDSYGVGSAITAAPPRDFTADIREIDGQPVAKRGRIPGMRSRADLERVL